MQLKFKKFVPLTSKGSVSAFPQTVVLARKVCSKHDKNKCLHMLKVFIFLFCFFSMKQRDVAQIFELSGILALSRPHS